MPSPVRKLSAKMYSRLTTRQRASVRNIRRKGLKVVAYKRKESGRRRMAVHNPFSDEQRPARLAPTMRAARRYPQAYDTLQQKRFFRGTPKYIRKNIAKRTTKVKRGGIIDLFFP